MENIYLYLSVLQWGLLLLIVFFNIMLGLKRGTKKTTYYTVVSVVLTLTLFFGISFLSIRMLFSTAGRLIHFLERFMTIPPNIRSYLVNPNLSPIIFALLDIAFKILALIILYPIVKLLLKLLVFRPLYNVLFTKKHYKKQIKMPSRFGGVLIGAFRGVFVTFILLMPIIVITGSISKFEAENENGETINAFNYLIDSTNNDDEEVSEIKEMISSLQKFHREGMGYVTNKIRIGNKSIDEATFDLIFTSTIKNNDGTKEKLVVSKELNTYGGIVQILIENGYLDDGFDFDSINYDDNYSDIDNILKLFSKSDILNILTPVAADILYEEGFFNENLNYDVKDIDHTLRAFNNLRDINWQNESLTISKAIKEVLLLGSVGEIKELLDDPTVFLDFSQEKKQRVGNTIKELSNLEFLKASNILVEYLLRDATILEEITWDDNPYEYLSEQLSFILNNDNFFKEELDNIGNLVLNVFKDEFSNFDYESFIKDDNFNIDTLLDEEASLIVSTLITGVADLETIVKTMPLLIDYLVYTNENTTIEEIADDISNTAKNQNYNNEINNINDIYKLIVELGISGYLDSEEDKLLLTDQLLKTEGNINTVKQIVKAIFEDSKAIKELLEVVSEPLARELIKDEELLDLALILINDEDFNYGSELVNILNIFEDLYKFTNIETIKNSLNNKEYVELVKSLADLNEVDFNTFKDNLLNLQTLKVASKELLGYVKTTTKLEELIIPNNFNYEALKRDLNKVLDLSYEIAGTVKRENINELNYQSVNLAEKIDLTAIKQILTFNKDLDEDTILLNSIINFLYTKDLKVTEDVSIQLPSELSTLIVNDAWVLELNNITSGLLNILDAFSQEDEKFILSINNLKNINGLNSIPAHVLTRFKDEQLAQDTFDLLLSSEILLYNSTDIINDILKDNDLTKDLLTNDVKNAIKNKDNLVELINLAAILVDKITNNDEKMLEIVFNEIETQNIIEAYNGFDDEILNKIGFNQIINMVFRESLKNQNIHNYVYDLINDSNIHPNLQPINNGIFNFNYSLDVNGKIEEQTLYQILKLVHSINVPNNLMELNNDELMSMLDERLNENKIDEVLNIKVIHELLSNVLLLPEVRDLGEDYFSDLTSQINRGDFNTNLNYNTYYQTLINALTDSNNLINRDEIKLYYQTYRALTISNIDFKDFENKNYNKMANALLENISLYNKNLVELTTDSILLRSLLGELLNDEDLLTSTVNIINPRLVLNGNQITTLTVNDLMLNERFFNNEGIKANHLYDLINAVLKQDLDIISRKEITKVDLGNLISGSKNNLSYIYDAEIITDTLTKFIEDGELNDYILDLINEQLNKLSTNLNISKYEMTENDFKLTFDLFDYNAAYNIVDFILSLNVSFLEDLQNVRTIENVKEILNIENSRLVVDKFTNLSLINYLFETTLKNDLIPEILAEIVEVKLLSRFENVDKPTSQQFRIDESLINNTEYSNLIIAALGSGLDLNSEFTKPILINELLVPNKIVGQELTGLEHILNSNIIYSTLDGVVQNKDIIEEVVKVLNEQLRKNNINVEINSNSVSLPNNLLDSKGRIKKSDYINLVVAFNSLDLNEYSQLSQINSIDTFKDVVKLEFFNKLLDVEVAHFSINKILQSNETRVFIANEFNKQLNKQNINKQINKDQLLIPERFLNSESLIKKSDILILVESLYLINITNVNSISIQGLTDIQNMIPKEVPQLILSSELVHNGLSKLLQSEISRDIVVTFINNELDKRNIESTLTKEDLLVPNHLLDNKDRVSRLDFEVLIDVMYSLNIDNFNNIKINNTQDIETIVSYETFERLLDSNIVHYLSHQLVQADGVRDLAADLINKELNKRGYNIHIDSDSFLIPNKYLDNNNLIKKLDILLLVETLYAIEVDNFRNIRVNNPKDIEAIISIQLVRNLIDSDLAHYVLNRVVNNEAFKSVVVKLVNEQLAKRNISRRLEVRHLRLPDASLDVNGLVEKEDLKTIVEVFYDLGIDNFRNIKVKNTQDIEKIISLNNFDKLINTKILFETINEVSMNKKLKVNIASFINDELSKRNINVKLNESYLNLPETVLKNGKIDTSHITYLLEIAYNLEFESFTEISKLRSATRAKEIFTIDVINMMLDSEYIYYVIGSVPQSEAFKDELARLATAEYEKLLKSKHIFSPSYFSYEKYGAIETSGIYKGYIKKDEFKTLATILHDFDFSKVKGGSTVDKVNNVVDELLANQEQLLDELLSVNLVYGTIDRVLNINEAKQIQNSLFSVLNSRLKNTSLKNLELSSADEIFKYHSSVYNEKGFISKDEIKTLMKAYKALDLKTLTINQEIITEMLGRNIDSEGKDDFDKLFESIILRSLITNVIRNERFVEIAKDAFNNLQNKLVFDNDMIRLPEEVFEDGLLTNREARSLLEASVIMGITNMDMTGLGIETIIDLEGTNTDSEGKDDLDRVLKSVIIHTYIDRLIKSESISNFVGSATSELFSKDIVSIDMTPRNDQLDETGKFSKDEIRKLLVSLRLLEIDNDFNTEELQLDKILNLINDNNDIETFLESNYIRVSISRLLLSNTIKEKLATSASFEVELLTLTETSRDTNNDLTVEEIVNTFKSLKILGITDFENISISNQMLKALSNDDLDQVLESNYFYQIIDLTLKAQLEDHIKEESLVDSGKYIKYIKKTEIKALIDALIILEVNSPDEINGNNITLLQLSNLNDLNSGILRSLMSAEIIDIIDVPEASLVDKVITLKELNNLIEMLRIILNDDNELISNVDMKNIVITTLDYTSILNIDENSPIITRLISEQILNIYTNINDDAKLSNKDIKYSELRKLENVLYELEVDIIGEIDTDQVTTIKLRNIYYIDSLIVNREMSTEIISTLDVPEASMQTDYDLTRTEMLNVIKSLEILEVTNLSSLNVNTLTIKTAQLKELLDIEDSPIITRLVSENVIKSLGTDLNEAALEANREDIKKIELIHLNNALFALGIVEVTNDLNISNSHLDTIQVIKDYNSLIIDRLISAIIIEEVELIKPASVFEGTKDIESTELVNFIKSANLIDGVDTIDELITYLNTATKSELQIIATNNQGYSAEDQSEILIATITEKINS